MRTAIRRNILLPSQAIIDKNTSVSSNVKWEPSSTLPRGRHKLAPEEVRDSQRDRLLQAMLALVGEHGYETTTVPEVVARARVSRNAFYELWRDKTECFVALCDHLSGEMLADVSRPEGEDWAASLRSGVRRYLHWWQDRPAFSRTYFLELPSAGSSAIEQRDRQYARFQEVFERLGEWARAQEPDLPPPNRLATRAIVHAVTDLVADEVRAGRTERLTDLEDDLVALITTLLTG
jgi:AcrR family transcriptional regulator